ncbi:MAG: hypothetical protein SEPTF4163_000713 [Sporothrix epigloea]
MGAITSIFQAIGACLMGIVNAIGAVIMFIVDGIIAIFDIIVGCLTCQGCSGAGMRRRRRGTSSVV